MAGEVGDGWTRAALVVGGVARRDGLVLLVHEHTLGGEGPDQWVLPGGRVNPGELVDAAVKREVEEETGYAVSSVGPLAFASQHYSPGRDQPLLFLAFRVELEPTHGADPVFSDPDELIIEARFVPIPEAIDLVQAAGVHPGSHSTAQFLADPDASTPAFWLWDLTQSTTGPLGRIPAL